MLCFGVYARDCATPSKRLMTSREGGLLAFPRLLTSRPLSLTRLPSSHD